MTRLARSGSFHAAVRSTLVLLALALAVAAGRAHASNCANDSTGLVPLIDLGPGLYQGFEGGRYAGGSNQMPESHRAAGVAIAQSIEPLDTLGLPDPAGRIVLISIGMSNTTQEFQTFLPKANADPARNPRLLIVDGAVGGQPANVIRNPNAAYWDSVAARLRAAGSAPAQVQAVWMKQANARPTGGFPASAETLQWNLASIARLLRQKLPSVRLCYVTSRIYAGYASTTLNPEPYAYESGFAVKWLIRSQIDGVDSLNFDPAQGPVEAPWIGWGPYLWADGMEPRSDGLVWPCSYFASDGTHPATGARNLVADSLLAFFKREETATPWFLGAVTGAAVPESGGIEGLRLRVDPVPASRTLQVRVSAPSAETVWLGLFTTTGRLVREATARATPGEERVSIDVSRLPSGIYHLTARTRHGSSARKVVIAR